MPIRTGDSTSTRVCTSVMSNVNRSRSTLRTSKIVRTENEIITI
jgi:hypothetical protein